MLLGGAPLLAVRKALEAGIPILQEAARAPQQDRMVGFALPSPGLSEDPPCQLCNPLPKVSTSEALSKSHGSSRFE